MMHAHILYPRNHNEKRQHHNPNQKIIQKTNHPHHSFRNKIEREEKIKYYYYDYSQDVDATDEIYQEITV